MSATSLDLSQIKTDALSAASSFRTLIGLGSLATQSPTGTPSASTFLRGDYSWQTIDLSGYQPLDSDLTAIAALSTTSFGRGLLTETSASTARTTLGLGTLATQSGTFSGTSSGTNTGDQDLSGLLVKASNLSDVTNAATARTNLGLGSGNTPTFLGALLTGGTVTASAPLIDATQTWNNAGTVFTGLRLTVTDTASSSSSLLMDLQVSTARMRFIKTGLLSLTGGDAELQAGGIVMNNGTLGNTGWGLYLAGGSGNVNMRDTASLNWTSGVATLSSDLRLFRDAANTLAQRNATAAQRFNLYGTFTNSSNYERMFLEYNTTGTAYRIGTEKAGTGSARALELQTDGTTRLTIGTTGLFTIADALNIAVGTTTGTKIGTATTQKLAFWNATPVVQPTAVADATDAASVITQLNALLTRMRNLGLIAT